MLHVVTLRRNDGELFDDVPVEASAVDLLPNYKVEDRCVEIGQQESSIYAIATNFFGKDGWNFVS